MIDKILVQKFKDIGLLSVLLLQYLLAVKRPTDGTHTSFVQGEFFERLETGGVKHV